MNNLERMEERISSCMNQKNKFEAKAGIIEMLSELALGNDIPDCPIPNSLKLELVTIYFKLQDVVMKTMERRKEDMRECEKTRTIDFNKQLRDVLVLECLDDTLQGLMTLATCEILNKATLKEIAEEHNSSIEKMTLEMMLDKILND